MQKTAFQQSGKRLSPLDKILFSPYTVRAKTIFYCEGSDVPGRFSSKEGCRVQPVSLCVRKSFLFYVSNYSTICRVRQGWTAQEVVLYSHCSPHADIFIKTVDKEHQCVHAHWCSFCRSTGLPDPSASAAAPASSVLPSPSACALQASVDRWRRQAGRPDLASAAQRSRKH